MARHDKTRRKIMEPGRSSNVGFDELRTFLAQLGFAERVRGSHHVFHREGVEELITLQRSGAQAKPYQVRQVREGVLRYDLRREE